MDEPSHPSFPSGNGKAIDPEPAAAESAGAGPSIVFCADPAQVRAGFALALQLMGIDAPVADVPARNQSRQDRSRQGE